MQELRAQGNEFAEKTIAKLEKVSGISVRVAFEQLQRGAHLSLAECLEMEFVIVQVYFFLRILVCFTASLIMHSLFACDAAIFERTRFLRGCSSAIGRQRSQTGVAKGVERRHRRRCRAIFST
jgi:hypothetical protein